MQLSNNQQVFLTLVRAGLWENEARLSQYGSIDFNEVYRLAEEQSVTGLVLAGLELSDVKPRQDLLLQWIGEVQMLEQRNVAMNVFVATLVEQLRGNEVYAIVMKGQGIAQCYERPLWRACGDVDLLLCDSNYKKAKKQLIPLAQSVDDENEYNQHLAFTIGQWPVELHGTLRGGLWGKIDGVLDEIQNSVFFEGYVRSWMNDNTQVYLLRADEDVLFVFSHILQHFFKEGIGLRQICDWCRLIWTYKDALDLHLLESRIRKMGVMTEWKAFSALTVDYLGMPAEAMPFYSSNVRWSGKAKKILRFVLETGNFGHNRDYSYQKKYPYVLMKAISLWKHIVDFGRYFVVFPVDSIRITYRRVKVGFAFVAKGK